jgi:chromosome segregation ATPase
MEINEFVKSLGIADDKVDEATKKVKDFLDGNYVTKARFNEVNESKKALNDQLADRDKQLDTLKKSAGENESLKSEIEKLQKANKEQQAAFEEQTKALRMDTAIKLAIADSAQDSEIVSGLIDKSKLILGEDGKVTGLNEQVEALKKEKAFLFKSPQGNPQYQPNGGGDPSPTNPFKKESFNLTEQGRLLRANPEQARQLAAEAGVKI